MTKLLVVDDDLELLGLIEFALRQAGYLVVKASSGPQAIIVFEQEQPDLVILDVNLPGLDGFEVCKQIRSESQVPIMMLTVRNSEEDQVKGLDGGADDFLSKPFSPRSLLARVRALLRRSDRDHSNLTNIGDFKLDGERQTIQVAHNEPIRLTGLELRLIQYLLANEGHTINTERLTTHVWGYRGMGDRQLLKQLVHRLRQKIEQDPSDPKYLITIVGVGYLLQTKASP